MKTTKGKLTLKNYLLGLLVGIVLFTALVYFSHGWQFQAFSNWKILILIGLTGLAFSLIMVPLALESWDNTEKASKKQKIKDAKIFGATFVLCLIFNFAQMSLNHEVFTWSSVFWSILYALLLAWYPY